MKLKTKRGAAKRFKRTGTGSFKRYKAGKSHLLSSKNRKRKRRLKEKVMVESGSVYARIKKLVPY